MEVVVKRILEKESLPAHQRMMHTDAVPLDELRLPHDMKRQPEAAASDSPENDTNASTHATHPGAAQPPAYVLLAVDGTWREVREMWRCVSEQYLRPTGPGIQVALPSSDGRAATQPSAGDGPAEDKLSERASAPIGSGTEASQDARSASAPVVGPCLIRQEPVEGFLTTYEALSKALAVLEGSQELEEVLMRPLRLMTRCGRVRVGRKLHGAIFPAGMNNEPDHLD